MHTSTIGLWALATGIVTAKTCFNATVEVDISARNGVFDKIKTPETNLDATTFALASTKTGTNITEEALSGYATVGGRYNISTQYCMPKNSASGDHTLQILTHGMGFDKTYWDLPYHNFNYSYVDYVLSRGYHTFSYDRLGIGKSTHGDAKNEIQSFLEIEALAELTRKVREGSVEGVSKPSKIVHVGHSFGSAQTVALSAMYPDLSDALVLTGFSASIASMPVFLSGANFQQAKLNHPPGCPSTPRPSYSSGYLVNSDIGTNKFLFFYPGNFDEEILSYAEQNKQPMTVGELMTMTGLPTSSAFTGAVYVIDGENDIAFCGGACSYTTDSSASIPAGVKAVFPKASAFSAYIQPNTGHGINLHYNSTAAYKQINDFLGAQGLMSESHDHEARHHHDF
ncbi:unnamed protein product [Penicillium salamii]|uniref:AB hydrolase-1 domain-containing protein n=1 Tax=Penicillium salamii TaxID=1612424 RepID=A0A9W4JF28_9EURO|nr:unnamed protein product [Penicillium salamii]CAG8210842.1 unnamed protein product [Penicillium salamii]CAG8396498.1 unnamed protein product [Penicillium salamii]CAG8400492.1 unnamed protein product [Penicillium salamii]CAG8401249.1 unnamed protein product [Penicillium salamii]